MSTRETRTGSPGVMLVTATIGFLATFWAWAPLSPLGSALTERLSLSSFEQSLVVAVPVIVGSLGRIPVGALTDRVGARQMFPAVALLTVFPVMDLGHAADSLAGFLGSGTGAVFALVAKLVEPSRVGAVTGVVGAAGGLGGFFPPLVMGAVYSIAGDYTVGFLLLAVTAALAAVFTMRMGRRAVRADVR